MSAELKYELFEEEMLAPLRGHELTDDELFVASVLLDASSAQPIGIKAMLKTNRQRPAPTAEQLAKGKRCRRLDDRVVKDIIRELRKNHEFPILSRKFARPGKPAGYWWCGNEAEMEEFYYAFRKQPMDELHTLSRIVKANYPKLAGQLTLQEAEGSE